MCSGLISIHYYRNLLINYFVYLLCHLLLGWMLFQFTQKSWITRLSAQNGTILPRNAHKDFSFFLFKNPNLFLCGRLLASLLYTD